MRLTLMDEAATAGLGRRLAKAMIPHDIITLSGPLGAGKTVLARALIRTLAGGDIDVPSPTFALAQTYDVVQGTVWHLDLYRLERPDDVWELGFEEALADFAVLIEWPERLGDGLPPRRTDLTLAAGETADQRIATLVAHGGSDLIERVRVSS